MTKITLLFIGLLSSVGFAQVSYVSTDFAQQNESPSYRANLSRGNGIQ
jgi:hypothetical protein